MVQTWGTGDGGTASCKKCGAEYKVTVKRFPMRDSDKFNCEICGELMNEWNSTQVPMYELISKPASSSGDTPSG
ncbi:hypothetical protein [Hyphomicrobium sp. CS1BSMeth3]|uniref:hypothetical protein n=1 Tax=Hyphomicrobium sp. CS1BSMeth3 TaxID=1892844 RepID=UPI00092FFF2E|nr:hypothetical protein [Hyphomicrobium sp. CS1BSMeth3]